MPKGPWKPRKLSPKSIRYLKAQEAQGKHLGFDNTANLIYTGELQKHSKERAAYIARRTAGMMAVQKGIHKGTRREHIPVVR